MTPKARMNVISRLACLACESIAIANLRNIEVHHILIGGHRAGDWYTIPLCSGHHQGHWTRDQIMRIEPVLRVSIADGRPLFTMRYPSERVMWEGLQDRLGLPKNWPQSKILPRKVLG